MEVGIPHVSQLQQARQRIEKWCESELEIVLKIVKIKNSTNEVDNLNKQIQDLISKIKSQQKIKKKAYISKVQVQKELQSECEVKRSSRAGKEKLIATLKEEITHLQVQLDSFKKRGTHCDEKFKLLEEEEVLSCKLLGLQIKKVKGPWLQFVFTQIDVNKPESCCFFLLKIDESRKYIVGDCQPKVRDIDQLLERLNSTNNLRAFVHAMRKRFVSHVR
ncbi:unnamed protein product [Lymnaea stagnalis]|uniref:Kinetochore protein SPC25 n=1 Tax=Lymnaea stagnalis TaxID=6523 RepID=A0AAV2HYL1_LYMST